jgi:hypothetical protein
VRAFVYLRELISDHADLARRIDELEENYDGKFQIVFDAIRDLIQPPPKEKKRIGYLVSTPGSASLERSRHQSDTTDEENADAALVPPAPRTRSFIR